jgi:hypothetical protein
MVAGGSVADRRRRKSKVETLKTRWVSVRRKHWFQARARQPAMKGKTATTTMAKPSK